jgi:hypothetical protein
MYLNDLELKLYSEMKKEEMAKEISANRYVNQNNHTPFYKSLLHALQKNQTRKTSGIPRSNCCKTNNHEVCC